MSRITVKMILEDALALIEDEESWIIADNACRADGSLCCPTDDDADKFTAQGAIIRTGMKLKVQGDLIYHACSMLRAHMPAGYFHDFRRYSQEKGHAGVIELFERAIASVS